MNKINVFLITSKTLIYSFARIFRFSSILGNIFINADSDDFPFLDKTNISFVKLKNINDCMKFIQVNKINLVILTDILPTQKGLVNFFKYNLNLPVIGITRYWSWLEKSKLFAKKFMINNNIPTSEYCAIKSLKDLETFINKYGFPIVLKYDGLKAGFGSYICKNEKDCFKTAKKILKENKFFIAEKFIKGEEVTLHTIWDGKILLPLEPVRDYKRLENNDKGINTGSMGSYTPVKLTFKQKNMINGYVKHLESVFQKLKPNFTGIFASDLIFTDENLYNLEFNMRPCTPEFEVLTEHIEEDLLKILYNAAISNLSTASIHYKQGITGAVNIVHKDYQKQSYTKKRLKIPQSIFINNENIKINANLCSINKKDEYIVSPFLKILTFLKNDLTNPFPSIYSHINKIKDKNIYYRTDIGGDL